METWAREPGARVEGHRAVVGTHGDLYRVTCGCGFGTADHALPGACLLLLGHLEERVRAGAAVLPGDDGLSGVREPRRPLPSSGGTGAALDLP